MAAKLVLRISASGWRCNFAAAVLASGCLALSAGCAGLHAGAERYSPSVTGQVFDQTTRQPIPHALVLVRVDGTTPGSILTLGYGITHCLRLLLVEADVTGRFTTPEIPNAYPGYTLDRYGPRFFAYAPGYQLWQSSSPYSSDLGLARDNPATRPDSLASLLHWISCNRDPLALPVTVRIHKLSLRELEGLPPTTQHVDEVIDSLRREISRLEGGRQ
jgi:hypothetical protein